jgi:hypothetical protein
VEEFSRRLEPFEAENTSDVLQGLFRRWRIRVPESPGLDNGASPHNRLVWSEARSQRAHLYAVPRNRMADTDDNPAAGTPLHDEPAQHTFVQAADRGEIQDPAETRIVRAEPAGMPVQQNRTWWTRSRQIAAALALVTVGGLAWKFSINEIDTATSPAMQPARVDNALQPPPPATPGGGPGVAVPGPPSAGGGRIASRTSAGS